MLKNAKPNDPVVKSITSFEIKDADQGTVRAVIATLGVVDRDGDIIRKGAIPDGARVAVSAYGHDAVWGNRPVGKGTLSTEGNKVLFDGRIFLNTTDGRDTFEVLKEMGADQEWSFGFRIMGEEVPADDEKKSGAWRILTKLDAFEVSPVLVGAGIGTRTLAVKQSDGDPGEPVVVPAPVVETVEAVAETPIDPAPTEAEQEAARGKAFGADIFARFEKTRSRLAS